MIKIVKSVYEALIDHAKADAPIEACGYLAGDKESIKKIYKMKNVDNSEEHFSFDPNEQFTALKEAGKLGLRLTACYHSHPATPSRLSQEDIRLAYDPNISYIIVSLAGENPVVKSFRIKSGIANEEEIEVIE
ncbi:MAG: M67 family metallopeptidase [Helicobacteraceae bacterium]|jgi:proteasome lid subunit RPN8/RPN11|nr:M67 family metallopeptidase [Helicobacteraceae bacterium]